MSGEKITTREEIQQAIGHAIVEQAKNLATYGDSRVAAEGLKDLAEALAWMNYPNQPH
jgi:hypothetical protein